VVNINKQLVGYNKFILIITAPVDIVTELLLFCENSIDGRIDILFYSMVVLLERLAWSYKALRQMY